MIVEQVGVTSPKILFRWTKNEEFSTVLPLPTYTVYAPNGSIVATGELTAEDTRYPYALTGALTTANGAGAYEVIATTDDPVVDNTTFGETIYVGQPWVEHMDGGVSDVLSALATAQTILNRVNSMLQADGSNFQFTLDALEQIPASASADAVADAVLNELIADHTVSGSLARFIAAIKTKTDTIVVGAVRYVGSYNPKTQTLTIVRGNTPTVRFENLPDDWTGATEITLGIRKAGEENTAALLEIAGSVYSASALEVHFPASFGISPELDAGEGIYEWDLTGKLANGDVQTAIKRSPFVLEDRIAQVS